MTAAAATAAAAAAAAASDLGRALCIVTGASRGFGRTVAKHLSRLLKPGSAMVLTARSGDHLRSLQAELSAGAAGAADPPPPLLRCVEADLADAEAPGRVVAAAKQCFSPDMDHVILVNNAASIGDVSRFFRNFTDMSEVNAYLNLNVSSCLCLTASVMEAFPRRAGLRRTVVNVSSLAAIEPFPSWSLYCTGKAAREMMLRVLAKEEPDVRILNYGPGPMETEMFSYAISNMADADVKTAFVDLRAQGKVLTCDYSCGKLMKVLLDDTYQSGAHVDIYDS